jgi:hypothetical protein
MSLPPAVDNYFKLTERGSTLGTELRAAAATFLTLCYILAGGPPRPALLCARCARLGSGSRRFALRARTVRTCETGRSRSRLRRY